MDIFNPPPPTPLFRDKGRKHLLRNKVKIEAYLLGIKDKYCTICDKYFFETAFWRHMKIVHPSKESLRCVFFLQPYEKFNVEHWKGRGDWTKKGKKSERG